MPITKKIKNDYNDWSNDELEHQQDRLYARLNNSKNDKTKFESILKDILDLENAMNRDPEKLSKKAKRFEYPWDKHKSQWKLNSKNEVEEDPENLKKVGRTKRSHKLDADVQTDIRAYINSVVINVNKYSETNETEFLTKSKTTLMSLIRVFEQVENEHKVDQSKRISKKSHNLSRQTVDDIMTDLNDIVAKLKQYTETDDISYITRAKSISITLLRRIEQFEKDDIRLNRYLKSNKKMNNIQKINKMLKKAELPPDEQDNNIMFQIAHWIIQSMHEMIDYRCTPDEISDWFTDEAEDVLQNLDMPYTDENRSRIESLIKTKSSIFKTMIYNAIKQDNTLIDMIANNTVAGLKKSFE